jgi:hypothetical protein
MTRWTASYPSQYGKAMNETLVKYLSGLLDADGFISFNLPSSTGGENRYRFNLRIGMSSSDAVDVHGFVASLPELTGFGFASRYGNPGSFSEAKFTQWTVMSRRDLEMLVPRLVKHMCVKARHLQRMFDKWKEKRGTILSKAECDELRLFSKESRCDSGPLKPKNHPTWAWAAGYLDGNGSFKLAKYKSNRSVTCKVAVCCHTADSQVLEFLKKAHGGFIVTNDDRNCKTWERNLGVSQRSFANEFLAKLVRHSHLKKHKIEQMLSFHHQQRPIVPTPAGEVMA